MIEDIGGYVSGRSPLEPFCHSGDTPIELMVADGGVFHLAGFEEFLQGSALGDSGKVPAAVVVASGYYNHVGVLLSYLLDGGGQPCGARHIAFFLERSVEIVERDDGQGVFCCFGPFGFGLLRQDSERERKSEDGKAEFSVHGLYL